MSSASPRLLIFSGPSGGHLFPAQAFAEAFHEDVAGAKLILVTSVRARSLCEKFPRNLFSEIAYLPEFGSPIGLSFTGLKSLLRIPAAILQSWRLVTRIRPDLCVGFGSFVSFFGVLFAAWRGIPTLIHEQNQVPGKATRMLQRFVRQIAVSFPKTELLQSSEKVIVTGLPIRKELREGMIPMPEKQAEPFTVLVCGGSQGSAFLNEAVLKAFSLLSTEERGRFAVIHITGSGQEMHVKHRYAELWVRAEVYPFFEAMKVLYNRAHMAISRAGANSSFEQAMYGIPTVFIPYPYAEGHQNDNALFFVSRGGAMMHAQNEHVPEWIAGVLRGWFRRPENYWFASRKMREASQNQGHALLVQAARKMLKVEA